MSNNQTLRNITVTSKIGVTEHVSGGSFVLGEPLLGQSKHYVLALRQEDIDKWISMGYKILEIGTGQGASLKEMLDMGIDVYAIEPALREDRGDDTPALVKEAQRNLAIYHKTRRVSAVNAVDAEYAFGGIQFDIALAIGGNFQNYAKSQAEMIAQLIGILAALKPEPHTYLTFGGFSAINQRIDLPDSEDRVNIDLISILTKLKVKFSLHQSLEGTVIKIYRINWKGNDSLPYLIKLLTEN